MAVDPPNPVPDAMLEAATVWLMRRREPGFRPGEEAAFAGWLTADPRHARALAEAERLWDALALPAAALVAGRDAAARAPACRPPLLRARTATPILRGGRRWAAAAALLLAVAGGVAWGPALRDDLMADQRTAVGERRTVELADGSRVTLNTGTALAVDLDPALRRVRLFRGEAYFDVVRDPARPFRVETPAGSVEVLGTRFNLRLRDGRATVTVAEGRVAARPASGGPAQVLGPGEESIVTAAAAGTPVAVDRAAGEAWRHGRLVFYRASLADVVAELERYRGGRILPLGRRLADLRVTGAFDTARPDDALDVIAAALSIEVSRLPLGLVLLH